MRFSSDIIEESEEDDGEAPDTTIKVTTKQSITTLVGLVMVKLRQDSKIKLSGIGEKCCGKTIRLALLIQE